MMLTAYLFYSFFGYLSGSVLYSYLIPKYFCHVDVRTVNEDQNLSLIHISEPTRPY